MRNRLAHLGATLAVCFILPAAASAATFTINDLTDTVTVSDTNSVGRLFGVSCSGEGCFFNITGLQGTGGTFTVSYNGLAANELDLLEPGGGLSDIISFSNSTSTSTSWQFLSDGGVALVAGNGAPTLLENGTSQPTLVIHYVNSLGGGEGSDVINIQSDVGDVAGDAVPEPASGVSALFGLGTLVGLWFRRRATRVS
jgi:PEP-CTERM motif-containing protein